MPAPDSKAAPPTPPPPRTACTAVCICSSASRVHICASVLSQRWHNLTPSLVLPVAHTALVPCVRGKNHDAPTQTQAFEPDFAALGESMKGSHVRVAKYQADTDREFASASLGLKTFPSIVYFPKVGGWVGGHAAFVASPLAGAFVVGADGGLDLQPSPFPGG